MNYKQHLSWGIAVELTFIIIMFLNFKWFNKYDIVSILQIITVITLSPLVMDLDHHQGKLREVTTFIGIITSIIGVSIWFISLKFNLNLNIIWISFLLIGALLSGAAYLPFYVTHHRAFMHSISFAIMYGGLIYFLLLNYQLGILGCIGAYSHLICDKEYFKIR